MEKKKSLLYGIAGGLAMAFLQIPIFFGIQNYGDMGGSRLESIIRFFSWVGIFAVIFFGLLLILGALEDLK